jgi:hypothetical protein
MRLFSLSGVQKIKIKFQPQFNFLNYNFACNTKDF